MSVEMIKDNLKEIGEVVDELIEKSAGLEQEHRDRVMAEILEATTDMHSRVLCELGDIETMEER